MRTSVMTLAAVALAGSASAQLDGQNVGEGLTLLGVQDTETQFGNAIGGGQDSAGGGEINALFAGLSAGVLNIGLTGNFEANFNKGLLFFDTGAGGENVAQSDNFIGGFNEINNLAGLTWDAGFSPDFAIQFEVGDGFYSIRFADLNANTGFDVSLGGGPGDLPLVDIGSGGITVGWDNSNTAGVEGFGTGSADVQADALSATTGIELSIDTLAAFGIADLSTVGIAALYGNAGLDFISNQILGETGVGGLENLAGPAGINFNDIAGNQFAVIPAPASAALLGLAGLTIARRRR